MFLTLALTLAAPVDYQKVADEISWSWSEQGATLAHWVIVPQQKYDVRLEAKAGTREYKVTFGKDGKDLFGFTGHPHSLFHIAGDTLFYTDFHYTSSGARIIAVDLPTGKALWKTQLKGLGPIDHSAYLNRLNMNASADVIAVYGFESQGRYIEFLDPKTGKTIGHKVFPKEKLVQKQ